MDESHHSFHGETQAAKFFRDVLAPEYTVLVTATPDDADIRDFEQRMGIAELHRVRIARSEAVESGLIKSGVKCAAYLVEPDKAVLVDLEATALRDGAALHRKIRDALTQERVSLAPLLLARVDSTEKSAQRAKDHLLKLGFTDEQIAIHTADEPDSGLLALANDESREVLIFKMAVALGFDAPRAFTLVSMRASREPDFGVQLVGRILRVHRRLQQRAMENKLPDLLRYGYVFLADAEAQTGLDIEADDPEKVAHLLNVILATNPRLLFDAQKNALAVSAKLEDADEIPPAILSEEPLQSSRFNAYGVMPPDLNSWERAFAEYLDRDMNNLVRWWHRNLPHKPWSVNVLLPDGGGFFPDFIVSIEGRKTESGVLLADPKFAFELTKEIQKTAAAHLAYGRVLILSLQNGMRWMTVRYDQAMRKPVLDAEFRVADAVAYYTAAHHNFEKRRERIARGLPRRRRVGNKPVAQATGTG